MSGIYASSMSPPGRAMSFSRCWIVFHLRSLQLQCLVLAGFYEDPSSQLSRDTGQLPQDPFSFPSVQKLKIENTSWKYDAEFIHFISLFSRLQNLIICNSWSSWNKHDAITLPKDVELSGERDSITNDPERFQLVDFTLINSGTDILKLLAPATRQVSSFYCDICKPGIWKSPYLLSSLEHMSHSVTNLSLEINSLDFTGSKSSVHFWSSAVSSYTLLFCRGCP